MCTKQEKTIIIGIDSEIDPFPEEKKDTKFYIFYGNCTSCGCSNRQLLTDDYHIFILCEQCKNKYQLDIPLDELEKITFVYWCKKAKFESDLEKFSSDVEKNIEDLLKKFPPIEDIPSWGVFIKSMICQKSDICLNENCVYNFRNKMH